MKTLLEVINLATDFLKKCGIERAKREAEDVIADALLMKRLDLYLQFERLMTENELILLREIIRRRGDREPCAYISGKVAFADRIFSVSSDVLIPRPETEILVEKISHQLKDISCKGKILWDICCGTGCIGITLKERFPELKVVCSDISNKALAKAKENAQGLDIEFRLGDLFQPFKAEKCDFLVCNPPYISETEYSTLSPEVRHEPRLALVSGKTGLEFYEKIAFELKEHFSPHSIGWLEIGAGQGELVKKIFNFYDWKCRFEVDWAGHDRFFFLESD